MSPFEFKVLGAVVERRIFSAVQEHCPPETIRHSLLAIRRSPFATRYLTFAVFLARQEPRPPNFRVLRPLSHVLFQVGGYRNETC